MQNERYDKQMSLDKFARQRKFYSQVAQILRPVTEKSFNLGQSR